MKRFSIVFICCFCIACGNTLVKKPDRLISMKMMVDIYYDLAIIAAGNSTNVAVLTEQNLKAMPYVYAKYGIDSIQLVESDIFYASDPPVYEEIYSKVQKRIEKEKAELKNISKIRMDSIKKVADQKRKRKEDEKKKLKDSLSNTSQ